MATQWLGQVTARCELWAEAASLRSPEVSEQEVHTFVLTRKLPRKLVNRVAVIITFFLLGNTKLFNLSHI